MSKNFMICDILGHTLSYLVAGERPLSLMPTSDAPPQFVPEVPWEFPRAHLYIRVRLGVGSFGDVWRAKAEGILGRSGLIAVACKIIKGQCELLNLLLILSAVCPGYFYVLA